MPADSSGGACGMRRASKRLEERDQRVLVVVAEAGLLAEPIGAEIMTAIHDVVGTGAKLVKLAAERRENPPLGGFSGVCRHRPDIAAQPPPHLDHPPPPSQTAPQT